ncbi:hypothetical protein [Chelativorans sp. AA-79]|uniref:hypothetical protein n=1 Tax=Chelativorans sp. AA-79 TaxID=3028735 RepID=UPI0023F993DB|nr:hypothetical protein [Chelativorans sp. AA-79]WEX08463.1 hypothetical protein PVE73_20675 [Chelativorans sp. AA-79]
MPLQNRVSPFGDIEAVAARGLFTGNRGVIHDPDTRTLLKRRWSTKAWIICECDFRGRLREVMGRNSRHGTAGWTELFFLDEVTALAAGHRPCFYCRRRPALAFARAFAEGHGGEHLSASGMDTILHWQRRAAGAPAMPLRQADVQALPDGAMVEASGRGFALRCGRLLPWSFDGYRQARTVVEAGAAFTLLTPPATVTALREGYRPVWHPSAGS